MNNVELSERIRDRYTDLSANHKKIAKYFLENIERIPFLSVQEISDGVPSSTASVVRFARQLGFSGFSDLREELGSALQRQLSGEELFSPIENLDDDVLTSVANQDIQDINETLKGIDPEQLESMAEAINDANQVVTGGLGVSYLLAQIFAYQLNQIGINACALRQGYTTFMEQILYLRQNDLLILLSFPPYSKETIEAAKFAREQNIQVAAITNKQSAPITFHVDQLLCVRSENVLFTNSFTATSLLINAISTQCALQRRDRAEEMLQNLNRIAGLEGNVIDEDI